MFAEFSLVPGSPLHAPTLLILQHVRSEEEAGCRDLAPVGSAPLLLPRDSDDQLSALPATAQSGLVGPELNYCVCGAWMALIYVIRLPDLIRELLRG